MLRRSAFLVVLVAFVTQVRGAELIGRVVKVSDGGTITALDAGMVQHKIRLEGIRRAARRCDYRKRLRPRPHNSPQ